LASQKLAGRSLVLDILVDCRIPSIVESGSGPTLKDQGNNENDENDENFSLTSGWRAGF